MLTPSSSGAEHSLTWLGSQVTQKAQLRSHLPHPSVYARLKAGAGATAHTRILPSCPKTWGQ